MNALTRFEGWLRRVAVGCVGAGHPLLDDLVNEGRIAMWQQMRKHGGEHAGFMTEQARLRMRQVARGEKAYGGVKVAVRDVAPVTSLEACEAAGSPVAAVHFSDHSERACLAYHRAEIQAAIARLTPSEQRAARKVMHDLPRTAADRAAWTLARRKLAADLAHLRGAV